VLDTCRLDSEINLGDVIM